MVSIGVNLLPNLRSQRELLSHDIEASHATAHNPHKSQSQSQKVRVHFCGTGI